MANIWGTHVFHRCVNSEQLGNACLSQMCQWQTAGEHMSFTNVSMANSWGTHVFHIGTMANSWGMHVFHKCANGEHMSFINDQ